MLSCMQAVGKYEIPNRVIYSNTYLKCFISPYFKYTNRIVQKSKSWMCLFDSQNYKTSVFIFSISSKIKHIGKGKIVGYSVDTL